MRKTFLIITLLLAVFIVYHSNSASLAQNPSVDDSKLIFLPMLSKPEPLRWLGPDGGYIVCLAISPQDPKIMYAGTWGAGVFKSSDGGATWAAAGLGNLQINALAVDPTNPDVVYAGPYREKLYKTTNGGQTWTSYSAGIQDQAIVYSIAVDPVESNKVYIGTRGVSSQNGGISYWSGILYRSVDGGLNWSVSLANVDGDTENKQDWAYSIVVDPITRTRVYAGMHLNGVYKSTNSGTNWTPMNNGITDLSGRAIVINPSNPNTLYYGTWHRTCVFKTDNGGTNWSHEDEGCNTPQIYNMALHPLQPLTVYLATFNNMGVIKTSNGGNTWSSSGLSQDNIYSVAVDPTNTNIVFAGTQGDGLFRSTNGGGAWLRYQSGISNASVPSLLVQPDANKAIYAVVPGGGVTRRLAAGQLWQDYNLFLPEQDVSGLTRSPANPNILFAYTQKSSLFYTDITKPLEGWLRVTGPLPSEDSTPQIYAPDHPFASREDLEAEVERIPQVGEKDALLPTGNFAPITGMAFAPSSPNVAYLTSLIVEQVHHGVYKSGDGGFTWYGTGLVNISTTALAVSPVNANVVYVASTNPGIVYYSTNGGVNWQETYLSAGSIYTLAFSAQDGSRVYAGTNNGVYVRIGEGDWTQVGLGGVAVTVLGADPARTGRLFAGTTQGVYLTYNGGIDWAQGASELSTDTIMSIGFDPLDARWVYFGTKTRGIVNANFP